MYVTDARLSSRAQNTVYNHVTNSSVRTNFYRKAEHVYSFRTGKGLKGSPSSSHRYSTYSPSGSNLTEKLMARKEYLEGLDRSFAAAEVPLFYSQGRTNAFTKVSAYNKGSFRFAGLYNNKPSISAYGPLGIPAQVPGFAGRTSILDPNYFGIAYQPTTLLMQNYGSKMHYSASPLKQAAGIGETIAEILSGNIPKITSNFFKSISKLKYDLKRAPKELSQDYLNTQFGIGPILEDLYKILVDGIMLHDALYGTSFRRARGTSLWSDTTVKPYNRNQMPPSGGFHYSPAGVPTTSGTSYGIRHSNGTPTYTIHQAYDMRFTARFTLARASSIANGYNDKALALVRQYGLWTPKLLWDLAPWSWVLDWYLNIGQGCVTAFDFGKDGGLRSDYACVTTRTTVQVDFPSTTNENSSGRLILSPFFHSTTTTHRIPVNPFGNFVTLNSMSSWQKSILIALGLARTK